MQSLRRRLPSIPHPSPPLRRNFVDARIPWVRDRALDHVVEKEKYLLPFLSLKDHFLSSSRPPPHSLPLSSITPLKSELSLPCRAVEFVRLFPSAFSESLPSPPLPPVPEIRPTEELLSLHEEELQAVAISQSDVADRLLKLLMLSPSRRLPLRLVERLRWDLGLPRDFVSSVLPKYPDYFCTSPSKSKHGELDLEVVFYRRDLAVSSMESYAKRTGEYKTGSPLAFPLHFSRNFKLDKKVRNWLDQWQKLPYLSPYESGSHLKPKSDLTEKWVVAVFHEALSLLIGKKTEKTNLVLLGEKLGLPPGFKRAILQHPGIFYVSNKLRTETVVLREGYRRHLLVEKHPVMDVRYRYVHLMHKGKSSGIRGEKKKTASVGEETDGVFHDLDVEDREFDDYGDDEEEEDDDEEESDDDEYGDVKVCDSVVKGVARSHSVGREMNVRQRRVKFAS
ncbi:Ubiquitin carboxyl-terminal hydrolase family protein [Rhynchospora pubera]|uniref:Ubiquitin carboxyl-terminal hydrolase family protein n=1 Tax=Rhynchospora pubera TaxID=906938 RepID=A0AAV8GQP4_9POAL|nr:Ubiquitin carboxyl-terminal hydrolase family protein [Rhynchospora pubera]